MENISNFIEASAYVGGRSAADLRKAHEDYIARKTRQPQIVEMRPATRPAEPPAPKPLPTYDVVRKTFWEALAAIHAAEMKINPNALPLQFSEHRKSVMRALCYYAIGQASELIPTPGKCLYIYGNAGTLKTNTMRAWVAMCKRLNLAEFEYSNLSLSWERAKEEKDYLIVNEYKQLSRVIDEFLRHTGDLNKNGNPLQPNESIIEHRYERWRQGGQKTIFISNIAPNDSAPLLSGVAFDRVRSMCQSLQFDGGSMRK